MLIFYSSSFRKGSGGVSQRRSYLYFPFLETSFFVSTSRLRFIIDSSPALPPSSSTPSTLESPLRPLPLNGGTVNPWSKVKETFYR